MPTFEQILAGVSELPLEQQELLIEIVKRRIGDERRRILAQESLEALAEFKAGHLKVLTVAETIAELRGDLDEVDK